MLSHISFVLYQSLSGSDPGTCLNVLTGLNIQIVYANVGALDNPQAKVLGAHFQYHYVEQLKYQVGTQSWWTTPSCRLLFAVAFPLQCIGPYCMPGNEGLPQSFEIISSVQFIDVSRPAHGASAAIPKVTARLPEDFFYPFSWWNDWVI